MHLLIYSELDPAAGGREAWLAYFLPELAARRRFRELVVHHLRPRPGDSLPARLAAREDTPLRFLAAPVGLGGGEGPARRFLAFARSAHAGLRAARPGDLVLAVGFQGEALPALGAALSNLVRRRGLRLVTWVREASLALVGERRGSAARAALGALAHAQLLASARVIANGADTLALLERLPWLRGRLALVPNAVDADRFAAPPPDFVARPLRVGFFGRRIAAKGHPDAQAVASLLAAEPGLELAAWGAGEASTRSGPLVEHDALAPEEVPAALAACHVVLVLNRTRRREAGGLSHALLEAQAAGRLIVAWDNPAHRQVLDPSCALLVPEGDVGALARALRGLLAADPSALNSLAARGPAIARAHSPAAHVERFLRAVVDPLLGA